MAEILDDDPLANEHLNGSRSSGSIEESPAGPDGFKELTIWVPWGKICAKAFGDSNGSPALAVHGWTNNAATFDRLIPLLTKCCYFVAVDLPGHGQSSHIPQGLPYHYTDFLIAIRRITLCLNWNKFALIGHSMGAGICALYAATFPSQVERLVMLDLIMPITWRFDDDYAKLMSLAIDQFLVLEKKIQSTPPSYNFTDVVDRLKKSTRNHLTDDSAKILLKRGSKMNQDESFFFTRDIRLETPTIFRFSPDQCFNVLSGIRSPLLIVKAKDATWFEPREDCSKAIRIYKQNCSSFEYVEFEGNHFVHLNEPEKIADSVSRFLLHKKSAL